jgi:hypothetical protein
MKAGQNNKYDITNTWSLVQVWLTGYKLSFADRSDIRRLVQNCYSSERGLFICHVCSVERTGGRSMQQHVMWHQKHPNEDYQTCNICQQCGKVCTDYNAMKFHVRQVHCDRTLKCTHANCRKVFKVQYWCWQRGCFNVGYS